MQVEFESNVTSEYKLVARCVMVNVIGISSLKTVPICVYVEQKFQKEMLHGYILRSDLLFRNNVDEIFHVNNVNPLCGCSVLIYKTDY